MLLIRNEFKTHEVLTRDTGLRNARAEGKKFGRPSAQVDATQVAALRRDGFSWSQVCRTLSVSKGSAQRSVARLSKSTNDTGH